MTKPEAYRVQLSRAIFRASLGVMRMCLWMQGFFKGVLFCFGGGAGSFRVA